jgi:hypothetical protein
VVSAESALARVEASDVIAEFNVLKLFVTVDDKDVTVPLIAVSALARVVASLVIAELRLLLFVVTVEDKAFKLVVNVVSAVARVVASDVIAELSVLKLFVTVLLKAVTVLEIAESALTRALRSEKSKPVVSWPRSLPAYVPLNCAANVSLEEASAVSPATRAVCSSSIAEVRSATSLTTEADRFVI